MYENRATFRRSLPHLIGDLIDYFERPLLHIVNIGLLATVVDRNTILPWNHRIKRDVFGAVKNGADILFIREEFIGRCDLVSQP